MDFTNLGMERLSYNNYEAWTIPAHQVTREGLWSYVSAEATGEENTIEWKDSSVGKFALIKRLSKLELAEGGGMRQHLVEFEELFERIENVTAPT